MLKPFRGARKPRSCWMERFGEAVCVVALEDVDLHAFLASNIAPPNIRD